MSNSSRLMSKNRTHKMKLLRVKNFFEDFFSMRELKVSEGGGERGEGRGERGEGRGEGEGEGRERERGGRGEGGHENAMY